MCPGFAALSEFRLRLYRAASRTGAHRHLDFLGRRCPAADLFPRPALVSAAAGRDLPDRVSVALGAGGWTDRRAWNHCRLRNFWKRRTTQLGGRACSRPADPVLAEFERRLSPSSLWRGRGFSALLILEIAPILCLGRFSFSIFRSRSRGRHFFSFQWDILLLETGFLAIFLAPWRWWPRRGQPAPLSRPALVSAPFSALQTDADVGRGEADQRRPFLVESERARLPLLDATAADRVRLVGR